MTQRWTEQDLAKFKQNSGRAAPAAAPKKKKYGNIKVKIDGFVFDSKLEGRRYEELKMLRIGGRVEWFIHQAPFYLPGGIVAKVDFLIKWRTSLLVEPRITAEDCKGVSTKERTTDNRVAINKRKQIKDLYGLDVELVSVAGGK